MKAILEFDMNDADDRVEHARCLAATDMAIAIFNLKYNLKKKCDHHVENNIQEEDPDAKYQAMDWILTQVFEELEGINIDKILQ